MSVKQILIFTCVFSVIKFCCITFFTNKNVCQTFLDYFYIYHNDNCWYDRNVKSSAFQIAKRNGYHIENHTIFSEDQYITVLYRISGISFDSTKNPVILKPGLGGSPEMWMLQGRNSIAFLLVEMGYDVWIATVRGSIFTDNKEKYSKDNPKYWNFSFHEIGIYDIPAIIDFVSSVTKYKRKKIIFIGHSMSTAASYVYATEKKEHAEKKLAGLISLAPIAILKSVQGFYKYAAMVHSPIRSISNFFGIYAFGHDPLYRQILSNFCSHPIGLYFCFMVFISASGFSPEEIRPELLPVFFSYFPSAIGGKTLWHFAQLIQSGKFQHYDYEEKNMEKYKKMDIPEYNINNLSLPIHVFIGKYDYDSREEDVDFFLNILIKNGLNTTKHSYNYAHADFFLAKNINNFYHDLFEVVNNLANS